MQAGFDSGLLTDIGIVTLHQSSDLAVLRFHFSKREYQSVSKEDTGNSTEANCEVKYHKNLWTRTRVLLLSM